MADPSQNASLIGFDVDGTVRDERIPLDSELLIRLLDMGLFLVAITGNTLGHLVKTLLEPLIRQAAAKRPSLLSRFFVFFQMGGALARFDRFDFASCQARSPEALFDVLLPRGEDGVRRFRSDLLDPDFIRTCSIQIHSCRPALEEIWQRQLGPEYQELLRSKGDLYDLAAVPHHAKPTSDARLIQLDDGDEISVQYTLRGLPSECHATSRAVTMKNSLRALMTRRWNRALSALGLPLVAKAGGSSSIDIVLADQNKAKALLYAMGRSHIPRHSVLYFGDELYPGGNDYSIPTELGVTCFSVKRNSRGAYHPRIFATEKQGPAGVYLVLQELVLHAEHFHSGPFSMVESFKRRYILDRIRCRCNSSDAIEIPSNVLQDLLTIITTAFRGNHNSRVEMQLELLAKIVSELRPESLPMGANTHSHPDVYRVSR